MTNQEKNTYEQNSSGQDTKEFEAVGETTENQATVDPVSMEKATNKCMEYLHKHLPKEYTTIGQETPDEEAWKAILKDAVGQLYLAHEAGGNPPTIEALVISLRSDSDDLSHNMANVLETMKEDPFLPHKSKKKLVVGIIVAIVALALIGIGVAYAALNQPQEDTTEAVEVVTEEEPEASAELSVNVTCEGWNADTSTPIVLAVYEGDVKDTLLSTDENIEVPDPILTTDVEANKDVLIEEITEPGTYTVSIVGSPLLEDGTIFEVPEPQVVEIGADEPLTVSMVLTKKAAEDVTEADIAAATAAATTAGVDTTKVQNASNATRSSASTAQGGTISQGQTTAQSKPASSTNSGSSTSTSSSSSTNSGNSGASTTQTSQPTHTHNWVYHDAVYKTVHHDAVTKEVYVCGICGSQDYDRDHAYQHVVNGQGFWESIENVVVTPAYDEQVLVSAAYYSCSGCGATK